MVLNNNEIKEADSNFEQLFCATGSRTFALNKHEFTAIGWVMILR